MKKSKFSFSNLAPKQQKALIILLCSVLGFVIVVIAASAIIFSTKKPSDTNTSSLSSSSGSAKVETDAEYTFNKEKSFFDEKKYKDIILAKSNDAGEDYLKNTVFVGDSNMERLVNFNLITLDNFVGKTGMGVSTFNTEACVYFENDNKAYTIPKAIAKMKPRRVVITFGTNDADSKTTPSQFTAAYKRAIQSIQKEYAYCDIIINTIPPVARQRTYNNISMQTIDKFNLALADLAKELDVKLLDSSSLFRGDDGFGKKEYFESADGIHFTQNAATEFVKLVSTHEYKTDDKRPDTKNIPKRRKAPDVSSSSSSSSAAQTKYIVTYNVTVKDGKPLGTLQGDGFSGETTKSVTFSKDLESFTITAVPAEGYEFVAWSDGVKTEKRTDTKVTQKFSTTAKFQKKAAAATIAIDKGASATISVGDEITLKAVVTGTNIDIKNVKWTLDGTAGVATGEVYTVKGLAEGSHTVVASFEKEKEKVSATITIKVDRKKTPISVSVTPTSAEITEGGEATFTASIAGDDAKVESIVWKLDGTQVAAGASSYVAKGLSVGTHTVTASIGSTSASASIKVNKKPDSSSSTPKPPDPSSKPTPPDPSSKPTPPSSSSTPTPPPQPKPVISLSATANEINENGGSVTVTASVTNGDASRITWTVNGGTGGSGSVYTFTATEVSADMDFTITASLPDGTSASVSVRVKNIEVSSPSSPSTSVTPPPTT